MISGSSLPRSGRLGNLRLNEVFVNVAVGHKSLQAADSLAAFYLEHDASVRVGEGALGLIAQRAKVILEAH